MADDITIMADHITIMADDITIMADDITIMADDIMWLWVIQKTSSLQCIFKSRSSITLHIPVYSIWRLLLSIVKPVQSNIYNDSQTAMIVMNNVQRHVLHFRI